MTTADQPANADVLLADGTIATIRPVRAEDRDGLTALHANLSTENVRLRFFAANRAAGARYVEHLVTHVDDVVALVALVHGDLIGLATAELDGESAEVSFVVAEPMHGRGVGTLLLEHLAAASRARGVSRFVAEVLSENRPMIQVFADAGFPATRRLDGSTATWAISTTPLATTLAAVDERESRSEARSLQPLLAPTSVAVVGVRRDGVGIGHAVLTSIIDGGYTGDVSVIHPASRQIAGVPAYPRITAVPDRPDLVVIAVPATQVLPTIADAAVAGVPAAVVITSGFGELGEEGRRLQQAIIQTARDHSMRLVGPNCLGLLCNDPAVRLNATFSPVVPPSGGLAIASQSGGVGIALIDLTAELGVGVRSFVSLGNQPDVSSADLLAAWRNDPDVDAAALYLESFEDTSRLSRVIRRFSQRKPLLALVGGRSESGARGGASHTAAATTPDVAIEALLAQAGVISCRTPEAVMHVAQVLAEQPPPPGRRVGIVSNAGGLGILIADAADAAELDVPAFSDRLRADVARHVNGTNGLSNPIDLGAGATTDQIAAACTEMLRSGEIDLLVAAIVRTSTSEYDEIVATLGDVRRDFPELPVVLVAMGGQAVKPDPDSGITVFRSARDAVEALALASGYAEWLATPDPELVPEDVPRRHRAHESATELAQGSGARWLSPREQEVLLGPYGIRPVGEVAVGRYGAASAAREIGFPVAVKVADPDVVHKTDRGLVRVGLRSPATVLNAVQHFETELGAQHLRVLVQPMADGVELALGISRHPTFGPVVMVAAGGVNTDLLDDRAFLVLPVTRDDALRALESLRVWPLLEGYRGSQPVDVDALEDLIVSLGEVARDIPQIAELDLNPVIVNADGAVQVDLKVRIAPQAPSTDPTARQLTVATPAEPTNTGGQ